MDENPNEIDEGGFDSSEAVDEMMDNLEDEEELKERQLDSYAATLPEVKEQANLYHWFWKVVRLRKPFSLVKVGNLTKQEIGLHSISVRDALNLWALGHKFHHPSFGNYFATLAKITSATSMAKEGWFMDLSISQKKVRARARRRLGEGEQPWRAFRKRKPLAEEE